MKATIISEAGKNELNNTRAGSEKYSQSPVLIVGSGRSGTTLMLTLFANHPQVFAPLTETRFLVDPGGLMDLVDDLTHRYSPVRAREALFRFERLMMVDLVTPRARPYVGIKLDRWFGRDYWRAVEKFYKALIEYEFLGIDHPIPGLDSRLVMWARQLETVWKRLFKQWLPPPPIRDRSLIREPRYFSDRSQLIDVSRDFVDDLFGNAKTSDDCIMWCEKTPHHLLHLDFLLELLPNAKVIHLVRDPRSVVNSFTRQLWAPDSVEHSSKLLKATYQAWRDKFSHLPLNKKNYLQVQLEELSLQPVKVLSEVQGFCGLSQPFDCSKVDSKFVKPRWKTECSPEQIRAMELLLGAEIEALGYKREVS